MESIGQYFHFARVGAGPCSQNAFRHAIHCGPKARATACSSTHGPAPTTWLLRVAATVLQPPRATGMAPPKDIYLT